MRFEKWQALGNDYLIVEADELPWPLTPERIEAICRPHFGVGADGILLLSPTAGSASPDAESGTSLAESEPVARVQIFNPDGSEAELSGNGVREAVMYLRRHGWTDQDTFTVLTAAGPITPTVLDAERCAVAMGRAAVASPDYPGGDPDGRGRLEAGGREWEFQHVAVGNPQCAIAVGGDKLEELPIAAIGGEIERHELFPNRTNVSFYRVEGSRVRARIFERGVGETLSSGTGACGAAVAAHLAGAPPRLTVELDGGELEVEIGPELDLTLTGWARPVYAGRLSDELIAELSASSGHASGASPGAEPNVPEKEGTT